MYGARLPINQSNHTLHIITKEHMEEIISYTSKTLNIEELTKIESLISCPILCSVIETKSTHTTLHTQRLTLLALANLFTKTAPSIPLEFLSQPALNVILVEHVIRSLKLDYVPLIQEKSILLQILSLKNMTSQLHPP